MLRKVVEVKRVRISQTFRVPILECGHKARLIVDKGRVREHYFCFCCMNKAIRHDKLKGIHSRSVRSTITD